MNNETQISEVAIYDDKMLVIGYQLIKYAKDTDGIFKKVATKKVYFNTKKITN